jgi:hypothetical protein
MKEHGNTAAKITLVHVQPRKSYMNGEDKESYESREESALFL